jgi:hypothetical protein
MLNRKGAKAQRKRKGRQLLEHRYPPFRQECHELPPPMTHDPFRFSLSFFARPLRLRAFAVKGLLS